MSDILKGIPVSSGIATGKAFILSPEKVEINKINIEPSQIRDELNRFEKAIEVGKAQIEEVKNRIARDMGKKYSMLFNAHKMMLDDCLFKDEVISMIRFSRVNAEYAIEKVINKLLKTFGIVEDQYFEERHSDIFHIGFRIIRILQGFESVGFNNLPEDVIIIAHDLSPVEMTELHKKSILGFITEIGSKTSHTAILARAFQIPAVVGVEQITKRVKGGESIVIDAYEGLVIINSDKNQRLEYARKRKKYIHIEEKLSRLSLYPAETKDGYRIRLSANLELPAEVKSALTHGADSIGLYRTEFLFLNRNSLPSEEEQFEVYKQIGELMEDKAVVIRTLDLGGDKFLSRMDMADEINPALGLRAIRLCLERVNLFKTQLRAILKASAYGNIEIMFPMISCIDEIKETNNILDEVKFDLEKEGVEFNKNIRKGMMIETPSAASIADILAKEVDFFSIGTNDLIQYMLAIDRTNESVAYLYNPLHPSILRTINWVVKAGHDQGIKVSMCGEMAGEAQYTLILLGLGLDELSMNPISIPLIKSIIRSVTLSDADYVISKCLTFQDVDESNLFCIEEVLKKTPEEYHLHGLL